MKYINSNFQYIKHNDSWGLWLKIRFEILIEWNKSMRFVLQILIFHKKNWIQGKNGKKI